MKLCSRECKMQWGCNNFKWKRPSIPKNSEHVHDEDRFWYCTEKRSDAGELEHLGEEEVWLGIDAVQDQGNVRYEFGDNVKCT